MADIAHIELIVGLEVHIELATRTKMFSRAANPAGAPAAGPAAPNSLIDPVVLGLPGALPVMNLAAVELSIMTGLALGCSIAPFSKWDRKGYFYPDLPKGYQISQYQLPLCFDGALELPAIDHAGGRGEIDWDRTGRNDTGDRRIGIIRAHLEEDAGKLLHEAPGGGAIDHSIVDWNRAGTPLLEIVTQPDFRSADEVVVFARILRDICRFISASEGIMQKGHIRFEPNINCVLTLADGRLVRTPIVEVKNLNSFKALRGAIEFELKEQPGRWRQDHHEFGPGSKTTRGWDEAAGKTFIQRSKEDAHDYRYFPDPDLVPVTVDEPWRERLRAALPELPLARVRRYIGDYGLSPREAAVIVEEREVCGFYEQTIAACIAAGIDRAGAGRRAANMILQSGAKLANARTAARVRAGAGDETTTPDEPVLVSGLGVSPAQVAGIIRLREEGVLSAAGADELFARLCSPPSTPPVEGEDTGEPDSYEPPGADPAEVARRRGLMIVRDEGALAAWCQAAIAGNPASVADVRAGKVQALGRLVGAAMKASGGKGDARAIREKLAGLLGIHL